MKISLKDFQILSGENTFIFEEGINMIVGPNGSGKSSLFYAVENCLTNPNGVSDCINYDADSAEVNIESNDESVSWIRTADSSIYKNNKDKKEYIKASKLDSRDIADLGFYFDKKNHVVNIHDEWSVLFPFGESDSEMFRLFEDIFNISCSFLIVDEMKKDEQAIKSSIVQNQNQKVELEDRRKKLYEIKEKVKLDDINKYTQLLNEKLQLASELRKNYDILSKSALLSNIVLPKIFDVSQLYTTYNDWFNVNSDYTRYLSLKKKINVDIPRITVSLDFNFPTELKKDYESYMGNIEVIKQHLIDIEKIEKEKQELNDKISNIKVCPTCGRPLV